MKFSVVIPVRNEAKNIESVIFYLRKTAQYPMEVIVVDGNSADQTFLISQRIADHVLRSEKSSRGYQMHLGAQKASGNFLIFLHADTFLPQNWQEIVLIYFKDKSFFTPQFISMAVFKLRFNSDRFIYRIIEFFANLRAKITRVYHGDQVWVIPKEIYFLSGGFPDVPLMEEDAAHKALKEKENMRMLNRQESVSKWLEDMNGNFASGKNIVFDEWFKKIYKQEQNLEVPIDVCFGVIQKYGREKDAQLIIENKNPFKANEDLSLWKMKIQHLHS